MNTRTWSVYLDMAFFTWHVVYQIDENIRTIAFPVYLNFRVSIILG